MVNAFKTSFLFFAFIQQIAIKYLACFLHSIFSVLVGKIRSTYPLPSRTLQLHDVTTINFISCANGNAFVDSDLELRAYLGG